MNESDNDMWKQYLSPNEQKFLYTLNYHSNKINKKMQKKEQFSNYTVNKVYKMWSDSMNNIITQLISKTSKINKLYKKKKNNNKDWWKQFQDIFNAVYKILTQKQHIIYVGITCIILSLFLHFIFVSS